jgi:hypothetical protein
VSRGFEALAGTKAAGAALRVYRRMPHYHFHIVDESVALNVEAPELPDYAAALGYARALAARLLTQSPYCEDPGAWEIRVTDEDGEEIIALPLSEQSNGG